VQSAIERKYVKIACLCDGHSFIERYFQCIAAFSGLTRACLIDKDSPHHLGSDSKEVCAVFPSDILIHQPQIRFMHKCSALQRMFDAFSAEVTASQATQFVIDQWQ